VGSSFLCWYLARIPHFSIRVDLWRNSGPPFVLCGGLGVCPAHRQALSGAKGTGCERQFPHNSRNKVRRRTAALLAREIIPVLQSAIKAELVRLGPWADDALLVAHLLAALEFARVGKKENAQDYIRRAFAVGAHHRRQLASLVPVIIGVATRPWHRGFAVHPEAQKALDGFSTCLGGTAVVGVLESISGH
jgi:hypothetical protein